MRIGTVEIALKISIIYGRMISLSSVRVEKSELRRWVNITG